MARGIYSTMVIIGGGIYWRAVFIGVKADGGQVQRELVALPDLYSYGLYSYACSVVACIAMAYIVMAIMPFVARGLAHVYNMPACTQMHVYPHAHVRMSCNNVHATRLDRRHDVDDSTERGSIFNNFSEHADGERRGQDRIGG